jgi:hypothetical protein
MKNRFIITALLSMLLFLSSCVEEMETINQPDDYPDDLLVTWLFDIQGTSADDIWIAGRPGILMHYDGSDWTVEDYGNQTFTEIYIDNSGTEYVCGFDGTILKNNGTSWSEMTTGTSSNLYGIGLGPYDDIYACGQGGSLIKLNESSWNSTPDEVLWVSLNDSLILSNGDIESLTTVTINAIAGSGTSDDYQGLYAPAILLVEASSDSIYWEKGPIEAEIGEWIVSGWSDEDTVANNWLIGKNGNLFRLKEDDGSLSYVATSIPGGDHTNPPNLSDIWVDENNSCWFTSRSGHVYKRTPAEIIDAADYILSAEDTTFEVSPGTSLDGIWGSASDNIYAVGYLGIVYHYDGSEWTQVTVPLTN